MRERAVRLVQEHRDEYPLLWAAAQSIAPKIGCSTYTLTKWVRNHEADHGLRPGVTTEESERIKALEREIRELRHANEILKSASAFFAQAALDRELKYSFLSGRVVYGNPPQSSGEWGNYRITYT